MSQEEIQIPKGWVLKTFEDIAKKEKYSIKRGPWGSSIRKDFFVPDGYKVYQQHNVIYDNFSYGDYYLDEEKFEELKEFEVKSGDFLISCSGTIGKIARVPPNSEQGIMNQALLKISLDESKTDPNYFLYFLKSNVLQEKITSKGSAMKNIVSVPDLKKITFFIPEDIKIQNQIVQKLDHILGQLEEKKKEILPRVKKLENSFSIIPPSFNNRIHAKTNLFLIMRNHISKIAFSGIISEKFRKNKITYETNWYKNIQQDISQIRKKLKKPETEFEIFSNDDEKLFSIPSDWIWTNIRSTETMVGSGSTPKGGKTTYLEDGIPFIRSQNVLYNKLNLKDVAFISKETHANMKRTHVKPNDVLLNITGASIGRSAPVDAAFFEGNVNQHVCIIRMGDWINPKYLSFWINSQYIQNFINSIQIGATKEGLNFEHVRSFPIPLPKIEEQNYVVSELEKKIHDLTLMQEKIKHSLNFQKSTFKKIDGLSQSILNSAFTGKLVN